MAMVRTSHAIDEFAKNMILAFTALVDAVAHSSADGVAQDFVKRAKLLAESFHADFKAIEQQIDEKANV
jgi:hypothetical protein